MNKYLILILFIYGCEEQITSTIIPPMIPDDFNQEANEYELTLSVLNGELDFATINWDPYENEDFIAYHIINQNNITLETLDESNQSSYNIELDPGSFEKIYLYIETQQDTLKDSIEVFTRPLEPVKDLHALAQPDSWSTQLDWIATNELNSIFKNYTIYRKYETDYWNNLFNDLNDCNCAIAIIENKDSLSYIDQSGELEDEGEYFYMIQTNTINDYKRNSTIKSKLGFDYSHNPQINTILSSQSEYNKIAINWTHNLEQAQFYELQLWRSQSENINPLNDTQLVVITDYNRISFEDYYEIGNGVAWFYKIKLIDIYGNVYITDIIQGNSHP